MNEFQRNENLEKKMPLCNTMENTYALTQSAPNNAPSGNGEYDSVSNLDSAVYTYYREDGLHFTFLPTGDGLGQISDMVNQHISIPIPETGFNLSVWFDVNGDITGNNIGQLPQAEAAAANALLAQWQQTFGYMAQEMMNLLL